MATKNVPQPEEHTHAALLTAFHNAMHHHKLHPTAHGLRLFVCNLDLAIKTMDHLHTELSQLRAHATELLASVEAEDNAVKEFNRRFTA